MRTSTFQPVSDYPSISRATSSRRDSSKKLNRRDRCDAPQSYIFELITHYQGKETRQAMEKLVARTDRPLAAALAAKWTARGNQSLGIAVCARRFVAGLCGLPGQIVSLAGSSRSTSAKPSIGTLTSRA